jgi:hypothetical protein
MTTHPILREVQINDYEIVKSLFRKIRMPSESIEAWKSYRKSPALKKAGKDFPFGWVLESGNNIVGYLANIPMMYSYQGSEVFVAVARAYAVTPEYRSHGLKLALKYFKANPVPQAHYNEALFLVFNS